MLVPDTAQWAALKHVLTEQRAHSESKERPQQVAVIIFGGPGWGNTCMGGRNKIS